MVFLNLKNLNQHNRIHNMFSWLFLVAPLFALAVSAPLGHLACPRFWTPEGLDTNGCPLRCINKATGEKVHLMVRYIVKGVLLKGCQQCEERWIENTDCIHIICPDVSSRCPNGTKFEAQASTRSFNTVERPRRMSKVLLEKSFPTATAVIRLPGNSYMRFSYPTQMPRYSGALSEARSPVSAVLPVAPSSPDKFVRKYGTTLPPGVPVTGVKYVSDSPSKNSLNEGVTAASVVLASTASMDSTAPPITTMNPTEMNSESNEIATNPSTILVATTVPETVTTTTTPAPITTSTTTVTPQRRYPPAPYPRVKPEFLP